MKLLSLLLVSACTHAQPVNFAVAVGHVIDSNAQCVELQHRDKSSNADSALCGARDGSVTFVSVSPTDLVIKPAKAPLFVLPSAAASPAAAAGTPIPVPSSPAPVPTPAPAIAPPTPPPNVPPVSSTPVGT